MTRRNPGDWIEMVAQARLDDPVLSPCVGVCVMDPASGFCTGCMRTLAEIAAWSGAAEETRRAIKAGLPARRALLGTDAEAFWQEQWPRDGGPDAPA